MGVGIWKKPSAFLGKEYRKKWVLARNEATVVSWLYINEIKLKWFELEANWQNKQKLDLVWEEKGRKKEEN